MQPWGHIHPALPRRVRLISACRGGSADPPQSPRPRLCLPWCVRWLALHGLVTRPVMKAAATLHLWGGGSDYAYPRSGELWEKGLLRRLHDLFTPPWGPAPSTHLQGRASLPEGERCPGQRCTDALGQSRSSHLPTAPAGRLALWGLALLARGSARAGIPHPSQTSTPTPQPAVLPRGVPLRGQSLRCGEGSVGGGLPQPQLLRVPGDGTHSGASTLSLHPATTVAPTARCWEEDEEGSSASLQGCSCGWLEAAGPCLSAPT